MAEEKKEFTAEDARVFVQTYMTNRGIIGTFEVADTPIAYADNVYKATITKKDQAPIEYFVYSSGSVLPKVI